MKKDDSNAISNWFVRRSLSLRNDKKTILRKCAKLNDRYNDLKLS